jgi:hypothetical protein
MLPDSVPEPITVILNSREESPLKLVSGKIKLLTLEDKTSDE